MPQCNRILITYLFIYLQIVTYCILLW